MHVQPAVTLSSPRVDDFRLRSQRWGAIPAISLEAREGWSLDLAPSGLLYVALGSYNCDLEAEAAAMEQLAELATEAARLLRARAAAEAAEA
jgi:hypothetical protein